MPLTRPVTQKRKDRHLGTAGEGPQPPHTCCQVPRLAGRDACAGNSFAHRAKIQCEGHAAREGYPQEHTLAQEDAPPQQLARHQHRREKVNRPCGHTRRARPHLKSHSQHSIHAPKEVCAPATGAPPQQETQQQHRATPGKTRICSTESQALEKAKAQHAAQLRLQPEVHMPECTCERSASAGLEQLQGLETLSVTAAFTGASVLITGATGYIGSLVRLSCQHFLQALSLGAAAFCL